MAARSMDGNAPRQHLQCAEARQIGQLNHDPVLDRHELIASRTQSVCRLHDLLRELVPGGMPRHLTAERAEALVTDLDVSDPASLMRVELALDHIEDMKLFDRRIDDVTLKIHAAVKASGTTVTRIYGVGAVSAGLILGEVGDVSRFPSRNHFASYTGTAPVAVSSGDQNRHRLNRAGNRRLNHAIHIAAIAQIRYTHSAAPISDANSERGRAVGKRFAFLSGGSVMRSGVSCSST